MCAHTDADESFHQEQISSQNVQPKSLSLAYAEKMSVENQGAQFLTAATCTGPRGRATCPEKFLKLLLDARGKM
jgi:hypothetical protein